MGTQDSTIDEAVGTIVEEYTIARDRSGRKQQTNMVLFIDTEGDFRDEKAVEMDIENEHRVKLLKKKQNKLKASKDTNKQTEYDRLRLERKCAIKRQTSDLEREKLRMEHNRNLKRWNIEGDFSDEASVDMAIEEEHPVRKPKKIQSNLKASKHTNKQT
ncbi:hypothetical protein CHS0354_037887 [Potamilus streckersoni]|uniref:Uncharacterized protein n=1 Tax=Potamilus streckersoni TaxID=2493646 RepID=A0AAE0T9B1_9BIVA|nr:hypothetical protein CHS0354_037887 [Potamilus streckersoni]